MVNPLKRLTDKELDAHLKRVTTRNPDYEDVINLVQTDGEEDVNFVVSIVKEQLRRASRDKKGNAPADYVDLCVRYRSLDSFMTPQPASEE